MPPRSSPAPPLAPLEYLQNQRRGSITDPSLHAANPSLSSQQNHSGASPNSTSPHSQFRQQDAQQSSAAPSDSQSRATPTTAAPGSPFVFGDASVKSNDPQDRRLLPQSSARRGSATYSPTGTASSSSHRSSNGDIESFLPPNAESSAGRNVHPMDLDPAERTREPLNNPPGADPSSFDYNMRRHSVPGGETRFPAPHSSNSQSRSGAASAAVQVGSKRKMSTDRGPLPSVGEEIDPELSVHESPYATALEMTEPATKRRNSAIDTQRIAQLSIYDRRDSIDSRLSGSTPTWWSNDRRDSSSSMLSSASVPSSVGFNSPAFPGEMHGRQAGSMSAFAWPPTGGPNDPHPGPPGPAGQGEVDPSFSRPYDPQIPQHTNLPPSMPVDRRLSVPDTMPSTSTSRPERTTRSRSRPPARAASTRGAAATASEVPPAVVATGFSDKTDESPTSASPATSPLHDKRDTGATPYSRSPELRVSHKLAERKRRKEMRDLFDELRDQLPADRGMKASKWEILSKAIDFIQQLKQSHNDMNRDIDMLRHELENVRHSGVPFAHPGGPHAVVYAHGPPPVGVPYGATGSIHQPQQQSSSRPGSSHNSFAAGQGPAANGKS